MEKKNLSEIIKTGFSTGKKTVEISYSCGTTCTNSAYIDVTVAGIIYKRIGEMATDKFADELNDAINELKAQDGDKYKDLHAINRKKEFHFYYHGFNSCSTKNVPVTLSLNPVSSEPVKTGVVKEEYQLVGPNKVYDIIKKHPDYELYKRSGFGFRGAQESRTDLEGIKKLCAWACCLDVRVVDNEIHVNGFSESDMY